MTTIKRWIDERSDADDFERTILRAELDTAPPAGAEGDVLRRVMAAVAPVAPGGLDPTAAGAPAASGAFGGAVIGNGAATLVTLGKGFVLGIGVSVAAATGNHYLTERPASRGTVSPPAVSVRSSPLAPSATPATRERLAAASDAREGEVFGESPSAPAPPARELEAAAPAPVSTLQAPDERAPSAPSVASFPAANGAELAASRLREEAALLRRARAELRAGALAAAFATLEASRQRFTAPELSQEREALVIELLYRSGERTAASARAREFLARFPGSPHAAAVRAFAGETPR